MRLIDHITQHIELINQWQKIDGQLCRLGINPKHAKRDIDIYNSVNRLVEDRYTKKQAFKILSQDKFKYLSKNYIEKTYHTINKEI